MIGFTVLSQISEFVLILIVYFTSKSPCTVKAFRTNTKPTNVQSREYFFRNRIPSSRISNTYWPSVSLTLRRPKTLRSRFISAVQLQLLRYLWKHFVKEPASCPSNMGAAKCFARRLPCAKAGFKRVAKPLAIALAVPSVFLKINEVSLSWPASAFDAHPKYFPSDWSHAQRCRHRTWFFLLHFSLRSRRGLT